MTELVWQRTPLVTVVFFLLKAFKQLVTNFSNFIPLLTVILVSEQKWLPYALAGGYVVFTIINAILTHRFFLFAVTDDAVHIRMGAFSKKNLTLKYDRIQQAELHETWYFRPLGRTVLRVDSAGSAGKEVEIPGLKVAYALELRQQMLAQTVRAETNEQGEQIDLADSEQQTFSVGELIRAGIIDNRVFLLLALLLYPLSQLDDFYDQAGDWLVANFSFLQEGNWWIYGGIVTGFIALLFIAAIFLSVVQYHNLTVSVRNNRFQARGGLLSIRTLSFRYHKLQKVRFHQNLRARLLERSTLRVGQLQPMAAGQGQSKTQFTIPVLKPEQVQQWRDWLRLPDSTQATFRRFSQLSLISPALWLAILFAVAAVIFYFQADSFVLALTVITAVWLLLQAYVIARWHYKTYAEIDGWLVVRRGVFGRRETWYPLYKAQHIDVAESPWLRLLGFADVKIHTAAGSETLEYYPLNQALELQARYVHAVASDRRRWM